MIRSKSIGTLELFDINVILTTGLKHEIEMLMKNLNGIEIILLFKLIGVNKGRRVTLKYFNTLIKIHKDTDIL